MKKSLIPVVIGALVLAALILASFLLPAIKEVNTLPLNDTTALHTGWLVTFGGTHDYGNTFVNTYKASIGSIFAYSCVAFGALLVAIFGTRSRGVLVFASFHFFAAMILFILQKRFFLGANGFNIDNPVRDYTFTWELIVTIVLAGLAGVWSFGGAFAGLGQEAAKK